MISRKTILITIFIAALFTGAVVFYVATKKPPTAADSKPVKEMLATDLINDLSNNQHATDSAYMYKNIAVKGKVKEIDGTNIILEAGESSFVNCSFDSADFASVKRSLHPGEQANIKGIYNGCSGFESKNDDEFDLLPAEKIANLKTCAINTQ